eukprot:UC4_evm2s466
MRAPWEDKAKIPPIIASQHVKREQKISQMKEIYFSEASHNADLNYIDNKFTKLAGEAENHLEELGFNVQSQYDNEDLLDPWQMGHGNYLHHCDAFVCFVDRNFLKDPICMAEYRYVERIEEKKIVPIFSDEVPDSERQKIRSDLLEVNNEFSSTHNEPNTDCDIKPLEFYSDKNNGGNELADDIASVMVSHSVGITRIVQTLQISGCLDKIKPKEKDDDIQKFIKQKNIVDIQANEQGLGPDTKLLEDFMDAIKKGKKTQILSLERNNLDYLSVDCIGRCLEEHKALTHLDLSYNILGYEGLKRLVKIFASEGTKFRPKHVNIAGNYLGWKGMEILADGIDEYMKHRQNLDNFSLESLNISDNNIGSRGAKYLPTLYELPYLKELICNYNSLNLYSDDDGVLHDGGVDALTNIVKGMRKNRETEFVKLSLRGNGIDIKGLRSLFPKSSDTSNSQDGLPRGLEELDLGSNCLDDEAAYILQENLMVDCAGLKVLDLSWNDLKEESLDHIQNLLGRENSSGEVCNLRTLILDGNHFDEVSIAKFCKVVFSRKIKLQNLGVAFTGLRAMSAKHFMDNMVKNGTINRLNLSGNKLGPEAVPFISELIKRSSSVTHLNLKYAGLGKEALKSLTTALWSNASIQSIEGFQGDEEDENSEKLTFDRNEVALSRTILGIKPWLFKKYPIYTGSLDSLDQNIEKYEVIFQKNMALHEAIIRGVDVKCIVDALNHRSFVRNCLWGKHENKDGKSFYSEENCPLLEAITGENMQRNRSENLSLAILNAMQSIEHNGILTESEEITRCLEQNYIVNDRKLGNTKKKLRKVGGMKSTSKAIINIQAMQKRQDAKKNHKKKLDVNALYCATVHNMDRLVERLVNLSEKIIDNEKESDRRSERKEKFELSLQHCLRKSLDQKAMVNALLNGKKTQGECTQMVLNTLLDVVKSRDEMESGWEIVRTFLRSFEPKCDPDQFLRATAGIPYGRGVDLGHDRFLVEGTNHFHGLEVGISKQSKLLLATKGDSLDVGDWVYLHRMLSSNEAENSLPNEASEDDFIRDEPMVVKEVSNKVGRQNENYIEVELVRPEYLEAPKESWKFDSSIRLMVTRDFKLIDETGDKKNENNIALEILRDSHGNKEMRGAFLKEGDLVLVHKNEIPEHVASNVDFVKGYFPSPFEIYDIEIQRTDKENNPFQLKVRLMIDEALNKDKNLDWNENGLIVTVTGNLEGSNNEQGNASKSISLRPYHLLHTGEEEASQQRMSWAKIFQRPCDFSWMECLKKSSEHMNLKKNFAWFLGIKSLESLKEGWVPSPNYPSVKNLYIKMNTNTNRRIEHWNLEHGDYGYWRIFSELVERVEFFDETLMPEEMDERKKLWDNILMRSMVQYKWNNYGRWIMNVFACVAGLQLLLLVASNILVVYHFYDTEAENTIYSRASEVLYDPNINPISFRVAEIGAFCTFIFKRCIGSDIYPFFALLTGFYICTALMLWSQQEIGGHGNFGLFLFEVYEFMLISGERGDEMEFREEYWTQTLWRITSVITTFLTFIVLLNVLIALFGDEYQKVMNNFEVELLWCRAKWLYRIETRLIIFSHHLYFCPTHWVYLPEYLHILKEMNRSVKPLTKARRMHGEREGGRGMERRMEDKNENIVKSIVEKWGTKLSQEIHLVHVELEKRTGSRPGSLKNMTDIPILPIQQKLEDKAIFTRLKNIEEKNVLLDGKINSLQLAMENMNNAVADLAGNIKELLERPVQSGPPTETVSETVTTKTITRKGGAGGDRAHDYINRALVDGFSIGDSQIQDDDLEVGFGSSNSNFDI